MTIAGFFRILFSLVVLALASACQSTSPSNVVRIDPDTYRISRYGADSIAMAEEAQKEAEKFCRDQQLYLSEVVIEYDMDFYQFTFRCLASGDPELSEDGEKRYRKKLGGFDEVSY